MNHRNKYRKLNMKSQHRNAVFVNMCVSLIMSENGTITTTTAKAKELRLYIEPLITKAKKCLDENKLSTVRYLLARLGGNKDAVTKILELSKNYIDRPGGYVRVLKKGYRHGDSVQLSYVMLVD